VLKKMDIKNPVFFADFHFENVLKALAGNTIQFAELNRFPSVRRDLALVLDRNSQRPALMVCKHGGMDIEEVAKTDPHSIKVYPFEVDKGITSDILDKVEKELELKDVKDWRQQIKNLETMFMKTDSLQIEINPWATNPQNQIYCVDAKINIDDNAKFRQKELLELRKNSLASEDVDPSEEKAIAAGLNYVALDGNIGCMVNGAGLAMATMDIIKLKGGMPANFLDVGGGANVEQVKIAFEILNSHPQVSCILINIFGGIMKCDTIAQGIIKAAKEVGVKVPLVCRLVGTNAKEGNALLEAFTKQNPDYKVVTASDIDEAAEKAVKALNDYTKGKKH